MKKGLLWFIKKQSLNPYDFVVSTLRGIDPRNVRGVHRSFCPSTGVRVWAFKNQEEFERFKEKYQSQIIAINSQSLTLER